MSFGLFEIATILITVTVLFSYLNSKLLKLPDAAGMVVLSALTGFGALALGTLAPNLSTVAGAVVKSVNFSDAVLHGMLSFILFASALHIDFKALKKEKLSVSMLASFGVLISTSIVGCLTWLVFQLSGHPFAIQWCMLFGAIISPTDPIAAIEALKRAHVSPSVKIKILGESLFNDGMGIVLFTLLLGLIAGEATSYLDFFKMLAGHILGGIGLGCLFGWMGLHALRSASTYKAEVLVSICLAMLTYSVCEAIHASAPIGVVVAGLWAGKFCKEAKDPKKYLTAVWELIDESLNAILFIMIGLSVLVVHLEMSLALFALAAIPIVLVARLLSVAVPIQGLKVIGKEFSPHAVKLLTWCGLRGGVSLALALSVPESEAKPVILAMTYFVVLFSILVQGMSIGAISNKLTD